jgi:hypothetical protein
VFRLAARSRSSRFRAVLFGIARADAVSGAQAIQKFTIEPAQSLKAVSGETEFRGKSPGRIFPLKIKLLK